MTARRIIYASDPRLRQKAKKVKKFGPELKQLADDMLETMRQANGVGLAGPQIGIMQRIFVAEIPSGDEESEETQIYVLVNPEISVISDEMEEGQEGCLSIPNWYGLVNRYTSLEVRAQNVNGKTVKFTVDGYAARVFQHENDHLDGILFIDHIKDREKLWQVLTDEHLESETEAQDETEETPETTEA